LASFATLMVDDVNESENNTIYVTATVTGKNEQQKLYEWISKYAGKENTEKIAPGLLESLQIESEATEDSVASRFAKYRKLYEDASEEKPVNEEDTVSEEDKQDDEDKKDDKSEDNKDEDKQDDEDKKDDDKDEDEDEQDELTAVILEVKKGDEDKAKDELIEAGVDEDDIEILTDEEDEEDEEKEENKEDEDETVKIKVAVDSFDALKEYLEGKGFDLEEELGGEIVSDDDEKEDDKEDGEGEDDVFSGFDDLDLFGGDEGEGEDK
ncbi:MAG: hypothetical protein II699_05125, partial [Lachnospiraceae bacterium]|nr:hypothetical protein [Lachnospiraceae bacterium]